MAYSSWCWANIIWCGSCFSTRLTIVTYWQEPIQPQRCGFFKSIVSKSSLTSIYYNTPSLLNCPLQICKFFTDSDTVWGMFQQLLFCQKPDWIVIPLRTPHYKEKNAKISPGVSKKKKFFIGIRVTRIKMNSYRSVINSRNERKRDAIFFSHFHPKKSALSRDSWIWWTFQWSHAMQKCIGKNKRNGPLKKLLNEKIHILFLLWGRNNTTEIGQLFHKLQKWCTAQIWLQVNSQIWLVH